MTLLKVMKRVTMIKWFQYTNPNTSDEDKETIRESFPLSEFAPVAEAGHWVHVEKPIKFLEIVTKFLKSD